MPIRTALVSSLNSTGLQTAERGPNPEDEVIDEEVELDDDVELPAGLPGGASSQDLFSTLEAFSQSQQLLSGKQEAGEETPAKQYGGTGVDAHGDLTGILQRDLQESFLEGQNCVCLVRFCFCKCFANGPDPELSSWGKRCMSLFCRATLSHKIDWASLGRGFNPRVPDITEELNNNIPRVSGGSGNNYPGVGKLYLADFARGPAAERTPTTFLLFHLGKGSQIRWRCSHTGRGREAAGRKTLRLCGKEAEERHRAVAWAANRAAPQQKRTS
ncbi:hypothetical protein UY3_12246 [Chelonia mydas]|uniref:Uncharacterized protein n=1 Tax=Chelonia mydas TaxID=8469 RepID=M7AYI2_CHEMY|nr:hypothetical protein UY3_12246 [Chelonia mydas]